MRLTSCLLVTALFLSANTTSGATQEAVVAPVLAALPAPQA